MRLRRIQVITDTPRTLARPLTRGPLRFGLSMGAPNIDPGNAAELRRPISGCGRAGVRVRRRENSTAPARQDTLVPMVWVSVNGIELYYESHGTSPALVLVPGLGAGTRLFGEVIGLLAASVR